MKSSEVLELVRAGWSKDEIQAMDAEPDNNPVPEEQPAEPAEDHEAHSNPPEPAEQPAGKPAWVESLEASIAAMTRAMQAANRAGSGRGPVETVQTTEDILREMFSEPNTKERK